MHQVRDVQEYVIVSKMQKFEVIRATVSSASDCMTLSGWSPRDCSGVLAVTFLEGAQGLLSRFVRVYPVFRLHHSRGRRGCSGGLVVASLGET